MRTLLVDNHDSYTYNLFQLVAETYGVAPVVRTNDDPRLGDVPPGSFDALIVSPGPGRPQTARDVGAGPDLVRAAGLPTLGVCLGHQMLARMSGADVVRAPVPRHGHVEPIRHDGTGLFEGLPDGFPAVRYHSLCVGPPVPEQIEVTAWTDDGVVMGLRHRELPWWGVQFHPESIATEHGAALLRNFRRLAAGRPRPPARPARGTRIVTPHSPTAHSATPRSDIPRSGIPRSAAPPPTPPARGATPDAPSPHVPSGGPAYEAGPSPAAPAGSAGAAAGGRWSLVTRCVPGTPDAGTVFAELFGAEPAAFWLDSSKTERGLSRFSYLGDAGGPHGEVLVCPPGSRTVRVRGARDRVIGGSIFDVLDERLRDRRMTVPPGLPFDLAGGYVGYFGYELRRACGSPTRRRSPYPDAVWMSATRLVVIDHQAECTWIVALTDGGAAGRAAAEGWVARAMPACRPRPAPALPPEGGADFDPAPWLVRPRERYLADIETCVEQLTAGESYEICLTNTAEIPFHGSAFALYRRQRLRNPAPYAGYLRVGGTEVLCSSPERFLKVGRDGVAESKPIKGTAPRDPDPAVDATLGRELASSSKTRAENLMIVDLLRNDLGRVCEVGTVHVPSFMSVESYATVHQLVSTVRGRLREDVTAVQAARACFPGGSMTGAPKLRTMEIIDRLERRPRGIYSGAIGFFGAGGTADLNIVIRTAVAQDGLLSVGAGGAIVLDSDPEAEYEEMLIKARAAVRGLRDVPEAAPVAGLSRRS